MLAMQASSFETGRLGFMGVRHLGMGGAGVGFADDENAILLNPTGLSRVTAWKATMPLVPLALAPNASVLANGDLIEMVIAGMDIEDAEGVLQRAELIEQAAEDYPYGSFAAGLFPYYIRQNMGAGLLASTVLGTESRVVPSGDVDVYESLDMLTRGFMDTGIFVSYAHDLPWHPVVLGHDGHLCAGITIKGVGRGYIRRVDRWGTEEEDEEGERYETDDDFNELWWEFGFGFDLAARLDLQDGRSTSASVVLYNLPGGFDYSYEDGTSLPVRMYAAIGVSSRPLKGVEGLRDLLVGFDIQKIGQGGSYHLGAEYPVGPLRFRSGLSGDGLAAGLGLRWRSLEFDYATYEADDAWFGDSYRIRNHVFRVSINL
jgi:hypothetical protein